MSGQDVLGSGLATALRRLDPAQSLLAFDLDGTLAPICDIPADARVSPTTAHRLQVLAERWQIAIITGRDVADARVRLGFTPAFLVGNHGAQRECTPLDFAPSPCLDPWRDYLRSHSRALTALGVAVEDKALSIALHYRGASDQPAARAWIAAAAAGLDCGAACSDGHGVVNVVSAHAHDKGDALIQLMAEAGASTALFIGDDNNDEPAFAKAPEGSVTVRIGPPSVRTLAQYVQRTQWHVDALLASLPLGW